MPFPKPLRLRHRLPFGPKELFLQTLPTVLLAELWDSNYLDDSRESCRRRANDTTARDSASLWTVHTSSIRERMTASWLAFGEQ